MPLLLQETDISSSLVSVERNYYKLLLIVGEVGSGKTATLHEFCDGYNVPYLNLGLELSQLLQGVPISLRPIKAEEFVYQLVEGHKSMRIAIDNTEILFEPPLALDPLRLFKELSKIKTLIVTWAGRFSDDELRYGKVGYQAYATFPLQTEDTFHIIQTDL